MLYVNWGRVFSSTCWLIYTCYTLMLIFFVFALISLVNGVDYDAEAHKIANEGAYFCIIIPSGAWCTGDNTRGQLGTGSYVDQQGTFGRVILYTTPVKTNGALYHVCYQLNGGELWCTGDNTYGQIGYIANEGNMVNTPRQANLHQQVSSIHCSIYSTCYVHSLTGIGYCLGQNNNGKFGLGVNSAAMYNYPVQIATNVLDIRIGRLHLCYLLAIGEVYCAGDNSGFQLGIYGPSTSNVFVYVNWGMSKIYIWSDTTCTININGNVFCWGSNVSNKMGLASPCVNCPYTQLSIMNAKYITIGDDTICFGIELGLSFSCAGSSIPLGVSGYQADIDDSVADGLIDRPSYSGSRNLLYKGISFRNKLYYTNQYDIVIILYTENVPYVALCYNHGTYQCVYNSNQLSLAPTRLPTTKLPTKNPTRLPTKPPTRLPSQTQFPSTSPSLSPLTSPPTTSPTQYPTYFYTVEESIVLRVDNLYTFNWFYSYGNVSVFIQGSTFPSSSVNVSLPYVSTEHPIETYFIHFELHYDLYISPNHTLIITATSPLLPCSIPNIQHIYNQSQRIETCDVIDEGPFHGTIQNSSYIPNNSFFNARYDFYGERTLTNWLNQPTPNEYIVYRKTDPLLGTSYPDTSFLYIYPDLTPSNYTISQRYIQGGNLPFIHVTNTPDTKLIGMSIESHIGGLYFEPFTLQNLQLPLTFLYNNPTKIAFLCYPSQFTKVISAIRFKKDDIINNTRTVRLLIYDPMYFETPITSDYAVVDVSVPVLTNLLTYGTYNSDVAVFTTLIIVLIAIGVMSVFTFCTTIGIWFLRLFL